MNTQPFLSGLANTYSSFSGAGYPFATFGGVWLVILVLAVWSLYWKARALWRAAHMNSKPWFIVFLLVNTLGILEILYLYVFSKQKNS